MTNEYKAPNTNKQFTSDIEYTGVADSINEKPKINMTIFLNTILIVLL